VAEQFVAMPFTPTANAHVSQVRAAIQYGSGANQVNLSLYDDANGAPGNRLAGPVTVFNVPSGGCCKVAIANFSVSVPISSGSQYWVVADTPMVGPGDDFFGIWALVPQKLYQGFDTGTGWHSNLVLIQEAAGAVYGTIP
jgi:hypothetical protein